MKLTKTFCKLQLISAVVTLPQPNEMQAAPIQVFIFAGQSNMVGYGRTENLPSNANGEAGTLRGMVNANPGTFGFGGTNPLVDSDGNWLVRSDVHVYARNDIGNGPIIEKGGHTTGFGIISWNGPEYGFGQIVGNALDQDVLILKVAKDGTSLGVNWRSPSAVAKRGGAVGDMWTTMTAEVSTVLSNLGTHFPEYNGLDYQVAGFGWHQGWNDGSSVALHSEYEDNMVDLIADVRTQYGSNTPVMIANSGMQNYPSLEISRPNVLSAQNNIGTPALHPAFVGNVAVVNTVPLWRPPTISPKDEVFHWHQNGITMYEIGAGMGQAYLSLIADSSADFDGNGLVTGRDFLAWQQNYGLTTGARREQGDADSNGKVDDADLAIWISQYGGAAIQANVQSIPEPPSLVVLSLSGVCLLGLPRIAEKHESGS
ncbi:MAG: sialate O-acetylesterase [Pseudomonadota bacterium]